MNMEEKSMHTLRVYSRLIDIEKGRNKINNNSIAKLYNAMGIIYQKLGDVNNETECFAQAEIYKSKETPYQTVIQTTSSQHQNIRTL